MCELPFSNYPAGVNDDSFNEDPNGTEYFAELDLPESEEKYIDTWPTCLYEVSSAWFGS